MSYELSEVITHNSTLCYSVLSAFFRRLRCGFAGASAAGASAGAAFFRDERAGFFAGSLATTGAASATDMTSAASSAVVSAAGLRRGRERLEEDLAGVSVASIVAA